MKQTELVILLKGNFVVVRTLESNIDKTMELLGTCVAKAVEDPLHFFRWEHVTLISKEIIGWYYREPVDAPTQQIIKFMEKNLPNDGGDDWKNED